MNVPITKKNREKGKCTIYTHTIHTFVSRRQHFKSVKGVISLWSWTTGVNMIIKVLWWIAVRELLLLMDFGSELQIAWRLLSWDSTTQTGIIYFPKTDLPYTISREKGGKHITALLFPKRKERVGGLGLLLVVVVVNMIEFFPSSLNPVVTSLKYAIIKLNTLFLIHLWYIFLKL